MGKISGILAKLMPRGRKAAEALRTGSYFSSLTEYAPAFSTWNGGIYEQALTRTAIERTASACSKLKPEVMGSAKRNITRLVETWPNSLSTWPQFLSRCMTILMADTTCVVVPELDPKTLATVGWYPVRSDFIEVCEVDGEPWVRIHLHGGDVLAIELARVAILTRFQYQSDFFGGGNEPLRPTMGLIDTQEQAQDAAMRNGANIRFIGKLTGLVKEEDMARKRERFSANNLSAENGTGIMLYDNTFDSVTQVQEQHYVIGSDEMETIEHNVYSYFGINEDILQNKYSEETFDAWYEGVIESFAIQLSEGLTKASFTPREVKAGNRIEFSSNRLEYATSASKRNMVRDMTDRGIMTVNEGRQVLQLPPVEGGDIRIVRGEYMDASLLGGVVPLSKIPTSKNTDKDFDLGGDDDTYNDTDATGSLEVDD